VADLSRLEALRRRVEKDPASIAFAQLAEEYRRAGHCKEAVEVCTAGLTIHPGYLSARVTLGRALIELNDLDGAEVELQRALKGAPENLAAIRGLAEIHHKRGDLARALEHYRTAMGLAPHDPDLEETVGALTRTLTKQGGPQLSDGLTFEQAREQLLAHGQPRSVQPPPLVSAAQGQPSAAPLAPVPSGDQPAAGERAIAEQHEFPAPGGVSSEPPAAPASSTLEEPLPAPGDVSLEHPAAPDFSTPEDPLSAPGGVSSEHPAASASSTLERHVAAPAPAAMRTDPGRERAERTVAALEQWLAAIDVARTHDRA
jgi:tetratricopeptide (TPR) repeat protein